MKSDAGPLAALGITLSPATAKDLMEADVNFIGTEDAAGRWIRL